MRLTSGACRPHCPSIVQLQFFREDLRGSQGRWTSVAGLDFECGNSGIFPEIMPECSV